MYIVPFVLSDIFYSQHNGEAPHNIMVSDVVFEFRTILVNKI